MVQIKARIQEKHNFEEIPISLFGNYLQNKREQMGITQENLCKGICNRRLLAGIESGKMVPDSMLLDALLERLGVGEENYEHYLEIEDYERWEAGMKILNAIVYENWNEATKYLETYRNRQNFDEQNKFEEQFVLSMHALLRRYAGAEAAELREIYRKAIALTMPDIEYQSVADMVLSLKELNLLLEFEQYRQEGARKERYLEIMNYVESFFDPVGIAKIYPKAVYFMYQSNKECNIKELRGYCDKALEYLRNTSKMYYLWEILWLQGELLEKQITGYRGDAVEVKEELTERLEQNNLWKKALEDTYAEFHVRKETYEYCYLYVLKSVYCISDVVRVRRKMLGISREKLVGENGIKSLKRLEEKKNNPQWRTVVRTFSKLGLPSEYAKNALLTENHQIKGQINLLMQYINVKKWEEADRILQEIKGGIAGDDIFNLQVLMQKEAVIKWRLGDITKEEYRERILEALELTFSFEAFLKEGEKYLTRQEQTCIYNLMKAMDTNSEVFKTCIVRLQEYYRVYEKNGLLQSVDGMYAVLMEYVASTLGNSGRYEESNRYTEIIAEGCLRFRQLRMLSIALYNGWWNNWKKNEGTPEENAVGIRTELEKIMQLALLDKQDRRVKHYIDKLDQIECYD